MTNLHKSLKKYRVLNDFTQKEIADKLKIQQPTYSNYENGRREPDIKTLIEIANIYNINLDELVNRKINKEPTKKEVLFKSEVHKEVYELINELDTEELYMLKGYIERLIENKKGVDKNIKTG
ncbi:MAG: helix-turn-helix transcriptional regulator [Nanopusillaceae archaeon]